MKSDFSSVTVKITSGSRLGRPPPVAFAGLCTLDPPHSLHSLVGNLEYLRLILLVRGSIHFIHDLFGLRDIFAILLVYMLNHLPHLRKILQAPT